MGAFGYVGSFTVAGPAGDAERVGGVNVTEGLFPTLGVSAALGRVFSPADDEPDAPATVVLSDGFWRRRFAGDPGVVGTSSPHQRAPDDCHRHPSGALSARRGKSGPFRRRLRALGIQPRRGQSRRSLHPSRRPTGSGRLDRRGARGARHHRGAPRARFSGFESRYGSAASRRSPRPSLHGAPQSLLLVVGGCRAGAGDRLREPRQPAAGARAPDGSASSPCGRRSAPTARRLVRQLLAESLVLGAAGGAAGVALAWWGSAGRYAAGGGRRVPRAADIASRPCSRLRLACGVGSALAFGALRRGSCPATSCTGRWRASGGRSPGSFVAARVAKPSCARRWRWRWCCSSGAALAGAQPVGAGATCRPGFSPAQRHGHGRVAADGDLPRGRADPVLRAASGARSARHARRRPPSAPSTSCRSAPTTTAAACRSKTIRSRMARAKRRRPDRSRPATSPPSAFRCCAVACSTARDREGAPPVVVDQRRDGAPLLARRGSDRPSHHVQQRHPARAAAGGRRARLPRSDRHRRRRASPRPGRARGADVLHAARAAAVLPHDDAGRAERRSRGPSLPRRCARPFARWTAACRSTRSAHSIKCFPVPSPRPPACGVIGAVRTAGLGPGRPRRLRRDQLPGHAAHPRIRRTRVPRRDPARLAAPGAGRWPPPRRRGSCAGPLRRLGAGPDARRVSLRRIALGSPRATRPPSACSRPPR